MYVIDDDPEVLQATSRLLDSAGMRVVALQSPRGVGHQSAKPKPSLPNRALMVRLICLALAAGLMAACTTPPAQPIALSKSFWQGKTARIGVAMVESPKGTVHMVGPQDALDKAIANAADARLVSYLETVRRNEFGQIAQAFAARLRANGYSVTVIAEQMERERYALVQTQGAAKSFARDLASIRTKYEVDHLLLLSVDRFGAFRDYFVFVPTAAPLAMFQVSGTLVDLNNSQVLWRVSMAEKQNLQPIEEDWDQPPDYPNLTQAIQRAEHDATVYLENAFFSGVS